MAKHEIGCAINPACGNRDFSIIAKTKSPLKIGIVGGGPAGMEAARVATERGHTVTIFEKTGELGGAILGCCVTPGKDKMKWYADWIRYQIADLDVDVRLCTAPGAKELRSYDVVVNATGAVSFVPETNGDTEKVIPFEKVMACPKVSCEFHPQNGRKPLKLDGQKVIVWGDHYAAADTVAHLASIGKEVTVVTDRKEFCSTVEVIHMYVLRKWFNQTDAEALSSKMFKHPVTVLENCTIAEVKDGEVVLLDRNFSKKSISCDHIVSCWTRPNTGHVQKLRDSGITVVNVGDAIRPRNLHAAVKEGAGVGLVLDEHRFFNSNNAFIDEVAIDIAGQLTR